MCDCVQRICGKVFRTGRPKVELRNRCLHIASGAVAGSAMGGGRSQLRTSLVNRPLASLPDAGQPSWTIETFVDAASPTLSSLHLQHPKLNWELDGWTVLTT